VVSHESTVLEPGVQVYVATEEVGREAENDRPSTVTWNLEDSLDEVVGSVVVVGEAAAAGSAAGNTLVSSGKEIAPTAMRLTMRDLRM
jgi:hypothetical protein